MAIYIGSKRMLWHRMTKFRLFADSEEELHTFATQIKIEREWFQKLSPVPHYCISEARRNIAIKRNAVVLTVAQENDRIERGTELAKIRREKEQGA